MVYNDNWRAHRRLFHQHFRPDAVPTYHPKVTLQNRRMLDSLLDSPNDYKSCIHQYAHSVITLVFSAQN